VISPIRITPGVHSERFRHASTGGKTRRIWICVSISVDTRSDATAVHQQNRHRLRTAESFVCLRKFTQRSDPAAAIRPAGPIRIAGFRPI